MSEEDKYNIKGKDETVANIDENQSKGESELMRSNSPI